MNETSARRAACTDTFLADGLHHHADLAATIGDGGDPDVYGEGGAVADLEHQIAALLGKPAAVFLPSGTMAQAATLRVHADARGSRTVVWHPSCHLELNEGEAYARVHHLAGRRVGERHRLLTLDDLHRVAEPFAALLLEVPQRTLGGQLPPFDDLVAQTAWARERGAAVHLDGARLWEATAGYGRTAAEIAALFDTVYVSFYKGVGAMPGCCVAGPADVIAEVKEWRLRLGGTLALLWPSAASARLRWPLALAEMPARMDHALAIAAALADKPYVRVLPDPPQTPMMHLLLETTPEAYAAEARRLAEHDRLWVWPRAAPAPVPGFVTLEFTVGPHTLRHRPSFIAETIARLAAPS